MNASFVRGTIVLGVALSVALPIADAAPAARAAASRGASTPLQHATLVDVDEELAADGKAFVMVELQRAPAVVSYAARLAEVGDGVIGRHAAGLASQRAVDALQAEQQQFAAALAASGIDHAEVYRVTRAFNGVALRLSPADLDRVRALPGVRRADRMAMQYPTNGSSVPFIAAPPVWDGTIGTAFGANGANTSIGIIDTGIDYQHPAFGGSGRLADYQANDRTSITDAIGGTALFPTAKTIGGYDFAGDDYVGSNAPSPDPDPMDCNGHGSHVAGTAAGLGVTSANATYLGAFGTTTDFGALKIGPGVAPGARLFALRVFGCGGGTNLTTAAIDWAVDPDGDGDLSDRLDVINMSLGSNFGFSFDASAIAADNATLSGMIVVASAGNAGDTFFISGSPGAGDRVIAVANVLDDGLAGPLLVRQPVNLSGYRTTGSASFGGAPPAAGLEGVVVIANDGDASAGGSVTDACQPLANGAAVTGNIALVDRGGCGFEFKAKTAQDAGAIGVIIANNVAGAAPGMADDPLVTGVVVPVVSISLADATAFKAVTAGALVVRLNRGGDTAAASTSRGPRGGGEPMRLKPDIAAPGTSIASVQTGVTCTAAAQGCQTASASGYLPGGATLVLNGTSMAAPHVAGTMAILRQLNPSLGVEEIKALALASAAHDVSVGPNGDLATYGAARVGSGRVDVARAATAKVIAYNDDARDDGAVAVTFDLEPVGNTSDTRVVRIVNRTALPQAVTPSIVTITDAPGVRFTVDGPKQVVLGPAESATITVRVDAQPSQMDRALDPTMSPVQAAIVGSAVALPRAYLSQASALLVLTNDDGEAARVALYAALRPHSRMTGTAVLPPRGPDVAPTGVLKVPLTGMPVCTGDLVGDECVGDFLEDEKSLVSTFELQYTATRADDLPGFWDVRRIGINIERGETRDDDVLLWGIETFGEWSTPGNVAFNICVDANEDGTFERVVTNSDLGMLSRLTGQTSQPGLDAFINFVFTPPTGLSFGGRAGNVNLLPPDEIDTALHDNNVLMVAATASQLGLTATDQSFDYAVAVCPGFNPLCVRLAPATECTSSGAVSTVPGRFRYNGEARGIFTGPYSVLFDDLPDAPLEIAYDLDHLARNRAQGIMLMHHFNTRDARVQVIREDAVFADGFEDADAR